MRPEVLVQALNWLRMNNPLYRNIGIDISNVDRSLTNIQQNEVHILNQNTSSNTESEECSTINDDTETIFTGNISCNGENIEYNTDDDEENDDPLNEHRVATNETCLQPVIPDYPVTINENTEASSGNEVYNVAPGENKHPVSFMTDKQCEELAFPVLFPKGQFGYTVERKIKLSPVKYFNARLLHYSGRFATNPEYLFFAQFIIEQKKVSDSINIALKKFMDSPSLLLKSDLMYKVYKISFAKIKLIYF